MNTPIASTNSEGRVIPDRFKFIGIKSIYILLCIYFVANQFNHTTTFMEIGFYGSLLIFIPLLVTRRVRIDMSFPLSYPMLSFLGIAILGAFFALNKENTIHDIYAHFIRYMFLWMFLSISLTQKDKIERLLALITVSTTIFCLYSIINQYYVHHNGINSRFLTGVHYLTTSAISIHTSFGCAISLYMIQNSKSRSIKALFITTLAILTIATILTQTRCGIAAVIACYAIFVILNKKGVLSVAMVLTMLAALIASPAAKRFTHDITGNVRILHALLCLDIIKDYPVTGIGFGQNTFLYNLDLEKYRTETMAKYPSLPYTKKPLMHPHNIFADMAIKTGLPGLAVFITILTITAKIIIRLIKNSDTRKLAFVPAVSLSSFIIIGMFEQTLQHTYEAIYSLSFALVYILWVQLKEANSDIVNT